VIRSETAGGQQAVDMRTMLQSLIPGVEHAEEADLGSKVASCRANNCTSRRSCRSNFGMKPATLEFFQHHFS